MPPYLCYRNFTLHSDCLGIVTFPENIQICILRTLKREKKTRNNRKQRKQRKREKNKWSPKEQLATKQSPQPHVSKKKRKQRK